MSNRTKPLTPRSGEKLTVLVVARISGCQNQKELSLDDQIDHAIEEVGELYSGPIEVESIATKGKSERLDRPELTEIEKLLRTCMFDLLVMEDIGRLVRGAEACRLWGIAVDHGTRCLAPNDCVDTNDVTWESDLMEACADHLAHNTHTSKRIKQKMSNRFRKGQGAVALPIAGYVKPEGANTYDDWIRVDEATSVIQLGLDMLRRTLNCSAVADFFNESQFKTGPYVSVDKWNGVAVRRFYKNPLLGGKPARGFTKTIKHHETGRRVSVPNTDSEPVYLDYPHLAHVDFDELQEVNALVDESNIHFRRRHVEGVDPLARKQKSRTKFPGQHVICHYCGRTYVWGGNGITENLMCNGPRDWRCWNSISINGALVTKRAMGLITTQLYQCDAFDEVIRGLANSAADDHVSTDRRHVLESELSLIEQQEMNVASAIAEVGLNEQLRSKLTELKSKQAAAACELRGLKKMAKQPLQLPRTSSELRQALEDEFERLGQDSFEFGDLLNVLVPGIRVYLVQLCTGGMPVPRAVVELDLTGHVDGAGLLPELKKASTSRHVVDLFEPPTFVRLRHDIASLRAAGNSIDKIVRGVSEAMSFVTVKKALDLHETMLERGLDDPYTLVESPPDDLEKMRRHKNSRYRFEAADGYVPPELF